MENKTNTNKSEHMTKAQKVIVVVTAIVLAIILILVLATRYMGSGSTYQIDDQTSNSSTDVSSDADTTDTSGDASSADHGGNGVSDGTTGQNNIPDYPDHSSVPDVPSTQLPSGTDNSGGGNEPSGTLPGTDPQPGDSQPDPTDPSDPGENSGTTPSTPPDDGENDDPGTPDVGQSGGIVDGASVTITEIGEATVTFKIGNETVVIPVQTTIFNGRVTKSGVISDSLCGYSIGASVMLYYPENGRLDGVSLTSSYVKADSTRLTVTGDYNGDASKITFRVNGVKLP